MKLDSIDLKILCALQKNGRISNVELAELVNLSQSPCLMRVKRLQSEGFITGYAAQINPAKFGPSVTVFTEVTLKNHNMPDFARFTNALRKIDAVVECHLISGGYDYLMKSVSTGIAEYQRMMEYLMESEIGIDKYFSYVVLKSPIVHSYIPIDAMLGDNDIVD